MEYKCLFGSKMLKLANCRDVDEYKFVNKNALEIKESDARSIRAMTHIISQFVMEKNQAHDSFKALTLYQVSNGFHNEPEYPFNFFNILNYKVIWINHLKNFINLDKTEAWATKFEVFPKRFYHLLYQYHMIVENTHWISDEAKVNVQKIHDLEMPSSYFYELRNLINSL